MPVKYASGLAGAIKKKPLISLREALHNHLRRVETERPPRNLHASAVTKQDKEFCPREAVLKDKLNFRETEHVAPSMAVTWEWGRLVETRVRDWFAEMGMTIGDWQCLHHNCRAIVEWQRQPIECGQCGGKLFKYLERRAISPYSGIGFGIDILLQRGGTQLTFVEVKSIDKDKFKELLGPLAEHKLRTQLGLRCIEESTDPELKKVSCKEAVVLYVSKGGYGTTVDTSTWSSGHGDKFSPFKEYPILRSDASTDMLVERARAAHQAFREGGPIPERICPGVGAGRAQSCKMSKACFSSEKW